MIAQRGFKMKMGKKDKIKIIKDLIFRDVLVDDIAILPQYLDFSRSNECKHFLEKLYEYLAINSLAYLICSGGILLSCIAFCIRL